jgi:hypothetical protein
METKYQHADIKNNKDVLDKISKLEKDLSENLKSKIVLIAYTE